MRGIREVEVDQHVGARLRSLRLMRGVTQVRLAAIAGISYQQLHKYEKGHNRVPPSKLAIFGESLAVKPEYFFDGLPSPADPMMPDFRAFITSRDGTAIMRAFQLLAPAKRTATLRLVQAIAARESLP